MNRIDQTFKKLKSKKEKAFVAYITAGDPDLKVTMEIFKIFDREGVDIIEVGVPFSDPIGDGPVNQAAAERALRKNIQLENILELIRSFRKSSQTPIVLFSYMNPLYQMGFSSFAKRAKQCGVDGVLTVDGPFDMCREVQKELQKMKLHSIYLVAPTTHDIRINQITRRGGGFIYYISSLGVTGMRKRFSGQLENKVKRIKSLTSKPVCVGFGISSPQAARKISRLADGVVVGSVFVKCIGENQKTRALLFKRFTSITRLLVQAVKA